MISLVIPEGDLLGKCEYIGLVVIVNGTLLRNNEFIDLMNKD
jgi:hypothetical protein